jgi:hypothetical protein
MDTNDSYFLVNPFTAAYIQDDLRLTNRLRLNLGLRLEREGGARERFNRGLGGGYYPGDVLPISELAKAAYARNPIAELAAAQLQVLGGVRYLGKDAPERLSNGATARPLTPC